MYFCYVYVSLLLYLCIFIVMYVLFCVFCFIVLFYVLFLCKCVLYYCHRLSTQLQLTKYIVSYHIIYPVAIIISAAQRHADATVRLKIWHSGQDNNSVPHKTDIIWIFLPTAGHANIFFRSRVQIGDNFLRFFFLPVETWLVPYLRLFQGRLRACYRSTRRQAARLSRPLLYEVY